MAKFNPNKKRCSRRRGLESSIIYRNTMGSPFQSIRIQPLYFKWDIGDEGRTNLCLNASAAHGWNTSSNHLESCLKVPRMLYTPWRLLVWPKQRSEVRVICRGPSLPFHAHRTYRSRLPASPAGYRPIQLLNTLEKGLKRLIAPLLRFRLGGRPKKKEHIKAGKTE